MRLSDTDAQGVVYYGTYFSLLEMGRLELLRRASYGPGTVNEKTENSFTVARAECDYRAPARFGDELEIQTWVGALGRSSIELKHRIRRLADGVTVAEGADVTVQLGTDGRPAPLTEQVRKALEPYVMPADGEPEPMRIAVGSENPGKLAAVRRALGRTGLSATVEAVPPRAPGGEGLDSQPVGEEAIRRGAELRGRAALNYTPDGVDVAVGMESGLVFEGDRAFVAGWCVVIDRAGRRGEAATARIELPPPVARRVAAGENLEAVIDELQGTEKSGTRGGAIGFLTRGSHDRRRAWAEAVVMALAPFVSPDLYGPGSSGAPNPAEASAAASVQAHRQEGRREAAREPIEFAVVTVSDTRSPDDDPSGSLIKEALSADGHRLVFYDVVPDEKEAVRRAAEGLIKGPGAGGTTRDNTERGADGADVIVITGGTGPSPRDVTPEAIEPLLDRELAGFGELFRMLSFDEIGAAAILSRAGAGTAGKTVIYWLPGSPHGVKLALDKLIRPEAGHVIAQLRRSR